MGRIAHVVRNWFRRIPAPESRHGGATGFRRVVLIHGIRTEGLWQNETAELLSPWFRCEVIKYRHFRHFGALKLVIEPVVLLAGLIATALVWWQISSRFYLTATLILVTLVTVVGGHLAARRRLHNARAEFAKRFGALTGVAGYPPHIIAHSLGTYLVASTLQKYPWARVRRAIFCGCVLPESAEWHARNGQEYPPVEHLRNEVGLRDLVPKVARALSRWTPHFGGAGVNGFRGNAHTLPGSNAACERCSGGTDVSNVHNVPLDFSHSSFFVGGGQCNRFWLPYLLGHEPSEFQRWIDLCDLAAESGARADDHLAAIEAKLLRSCWGWSGRAPLVGELERRVLQEFQRKHNYEPPPDAIQEMVYAAVGLIWNLVRAALEEREKGRDAAHNLVRAIDPSVALQRAVIEAVRLHVNPRGGDDD